MNIFRVLSKGDGSVSEPNVTSVLTFLLDPTENHGMGSVFLECFLLKLADESLLESDFKAFVESNIKIRSSNSIQTSTDFQVSVDSEVRIDIPKKENERDVDILIEIQKSSTNESYLLVIENKIKKTSIVKGQLEDIFNYYNYSETNEIYNCISYLLLLPESSEKYKIVSDNFKICFYDSFLNSVLEDMLNKESLGNLPPINDFTKLFIKSLKQFIINNFSFKENFNYSKVKNILIKTKGLDNTKNEHPFEVLKDSVEFLLSMVIKKDLKSLNQQLKIGSYPAIKTTSEFKSYVEDSEKNYREKNKISTKNKQFKDYSKRLKNRYSTFDKSYDIKDQMFCTQITSSGNKPNIIQFIKDVKVVLSDQLDSVVITDENGLDITF